MAVQSDSQNLNKENIKLAGNVFLWTIFAAVLNFIIYMSITMIISGITTKAIGEQIYETAENGKRILVTEIIYDKTSTTTTQTGSQTGSTAASTASTASTDNSATTVSTNASGTTTASGGTAASGTASQTAGTTLKENQTKIVKYSEMPASASTALDIITQTFMLILFVAMIYTKLWERGDKDNNSVHFGRMNEDRLRGLKIGLFAAIPSFLFYVLLILSKLKLIMPGYFFLYRFLNISFLPIVSRIAGKNNFSAADVSWLSVFAILLTLFVSPLVCHIAYLLGYKQISISEKIIYVDPKKRRKKRRY